MNILDQDLSRFYSSNPLEVLGVDTKATNNDIAKAYRKLALKWHPDRNGGKSKEDTDKIQDIFKRIKHAYEMETDEKYAKEFIDKNGFSYKHACRAKGELVGFRESDEFKAQLKVWKRQGPTGKETIAFSTPPIISSSSNFTLQNRQGLKQTFRNLLDQTEFSLQKILTGPYFRTIETIPLLPKNLKQFLLRPVSNKIFSFFQGELTFVKPKDFSSEIKLAETLCQYVDINLPFDLPTQKMVEEAQKFAQEIENKYFYEQNEKICRTIKNYFNAQSRISSYSIPLIDPKSKEAEVLNIVPTMATKYTEGQKRPAPIFTKTSEKNTTICNICKNSFGIFNSMKNCVACGKACCGSCLTFKKFPEYQKPIRVCKSHGMQDYKEIWKNPLNDTESLKQVSSQYLLMLDITGYASGKEFKSWIKKFVDLGKYNLAAQCAYAAGGEWVELAKAFIQKGLFKQASDSLNYLRKNKRILKDNFTLNWQESRHPDSIHQMNGKTSVKELYNQEDWFKEAQKHAEESMGIALLCYQKAFYGEEGADVLLKKALENFNQPLGQALMILALQANGYLNKGIVEFAEILLQNEISLSHKYSILGFFCLLKKASLKQWIELIDSLAIEHAPPLLQLMDTYLKPDWHTVQLKQDRNFLLWQYYSNLECYGSSKLSQWITLLIYAMMEGTGEAALAYFKAHFKNLDFIEERDQYLESAKYLPALICHYIAPQSLSWEDLAIKFQRKNPIFSLLCQSVSASNLIELGDQYFKKGSYVLAFQCYLSERNAKKLQECLQHIPSPEKLSYLKALWDITHETIYLEKICEELILLKEKELLKQMILSIIQGISNAENFKFFQWLYEHFELSLEQKIGFFEGIHSFSQNVDQTWLKNAFEDVKISLQKMMYLAFHLNDLETLYNFTDLLTPDTWKAIDEILRDFKEEAMYGPYKSAVLYMQALLNLFHPVKPDYWKTMAALNKAMLNHPDPQKMPYYSKVIEKVSELPYAKFKSTYTQFGQLNFPEASQFSGKLTGSPSLKLMELIDQTLFKIRKEAALSYYDLRMTDLGPDGMVASCLAASFEFAKLLLQKNHPKKTYAYKNAIFNLVYTAFASAHLYLSPPSRLYTYKICISLLTTAFDKACKITPEERDFLHTLYQEYETTFKLMPLTLPSSLSSSDLLFYDYTNRKVTNTYFKRLREKPALQNDPKLQYEYLSGTWNHWLDQEDFDFNQERIRAMELLLKEKNQTFQQVENLLRWPPLVRDEQGWLPPEPLPLFLSEVHFSKVEGVTFDLDTGEVIFNFTRSEDPMQQLFDMNDVEDIFRGGIGGAQFTLDQPDPNLAYHPFQNMRYAPATLTRTNYLGTLLHADYTLKMLSTGKEVCAAAPFAMRDVEESLLQRFPEDLQEKFMTYYLKKQGDRGDRFWIEAENLTYVKSEQGNKITYTFGECEMSVKNHRLIRDKDGKLVDAPEEEDPNHLSPQAEFAQMLTEEYENIGKAFPEFARLAELAKLQAIFKFSLDLVKTSIEAKIQISVSEIPTILNDLRKKVTYPVNVSDVVNKFLKNQGLTQYQISTYELNQLTDQVKLECKKIDQKNLEDLVDVLKQGFQVNGFEISELTNFTKEWLLGNSLALHAFLKRKIEADGKSGAVKIRKTFDNLGITFLPVHTATDACTWVPATFKESDHHKVYGGVNMNPNLRTPCQPGGIGSTLPPRGPFIAQYQHRIVLLPNGRIDGTNVRVDPVTGNTYIDPYTNKQHIALTVSSCIRDQWSGRNGYPPNTVAYWATGVGYTDIHHYSRHYDVKSVHLHNINGYTSCTWKKQTTIYKQGDEHNCKDKPK